MIQITKELFDTILLTLIKSGNKMAALQVVQRALSLNQKEALDYVNGLPVEKGE